MIVLSCCWVLYIRNHKFSHAIRFVNSQIFNSWMNSLQKSELWFFLIHDYNVFICHFSLLNSISLIQNIEFSSIFSNDEFIIMKSNSWIHFEYNEFLISEFIYLWMHIWIQNPYIWIHIHEFIYIWIHVFISYLNSNVYEFI